MKHTPIGLGDLVMVVRSCCDAFPKKYPGWMGVPRTVIHLTTASPGIKCALCGWTAYDVKMVYMKLDHPTGELLRASGGRDAVGAPLAWVVKIEPPTQQMRDEVANDIKNKVLA